MSLPSSLLSAIASREGGRVVLVVGAGCSFEDPTKLPLAGKCSEEAHRRLVADGLLNEGECTEPWNLSALADLVKAKHSGKQQELVSRLPITEFRNASPNQGHKIAAALMVEGAIWNVVTLNFDLALSHALSEIGVGNAVCIINGPEQHDQLGRSNVIYLHRSIDADPETLILTTNDLEAAWVDGWEEWVSKWAMAAPITVFAGLGSSCGVLRHTAEKLRTALGDKVQLLLANPGDRALSKFASEMQIEEANYVQLGWIAFMCDLGQRFHLETVARIEKACEALSQREGWTIPDTCQPTEDVVELANRIREMDILTFGRLRAAWMLDSRAYPKLEDAHLSSIADLLLAVAYVSRVRNCEFRIAENGHVVFTEAGSPESRVRLVDGSAVNYRWLTLESDLRQQDQHRPFGRENARHVLACGVTGRRPETATPPESIVDVGAEEHSIVRGDCRYSFWGVDEVRGDDSVPEALLS
jgi:hypothetical protein